MVKFFFNQKNLQNINCFSNEGNNWKKTQMKLDEKKLFIKFKEKFLHRRGRINCSLWEEGGKWRWLGIQYVIAEY